MRYLIAYHLEGESGRLVNELRRDIAEEFDVREALYLPPHMTLFYPFEMFGVRLRELEGVLAGFASSRDAFDLKIPGFSFFGEKVWFIDVEQSRELHDLKQQLAGVMGDKMGIDEEQKGRKGVHFHITLAYQDVTPEKFDLIGEYLSGLRCPIDELRVDAITLMESRDEKWVVVKKFEMKK